METAKHNNPDVEKFLTEEGRMLTIFERRPHYKFGDTETIRRNFNIEAFGKEKSHAVENLITDISEWVGTSAIFDKFNDHAKRREWEGEIEQKYLKGKRAIVEFLKSNKLNMSRTGILINNIKLLFNWDKNDEIIDRDTKAILLHELEVAVAEFKQVLQLANTQYETQEDVRNVLSKDMNFSDFEIDYIIARQDVNLITNPEMRRKILAIIHELEAIACEVLEKFERKG